MIKTITLLTLLILATFTDIQTKKIPNIIFCVGMITGIAFDFVYPRSHVEIILAYIGAFIVFLFGSLRLMGMGDIKIWIVLTVYEGLLKSAAIICIATVLFIIFHIIKNPRNFSTVLLGFSQAITNKKIQASGKQGYAFIPFVTVCTIICKVVEIIW